ncbi:hypothetical protein CHELA1G11_12543 [Hyphomicrobiales bacterium]|nr:hypothetical protein CHELA1G11_12543 [Hyphomicrobiales bacterium]
MIRLPFAWIKYPSASPLSLATQALPIRSNDLILREPLVRRPVTQLREEMALTGRATLDDIHQCILWTP